ncbi:hypothetical protein [Neobacillus ginsengisoli]|uniref:Uncharacterized protein n=1 Tax=Neobacillus ginsengisoli TaxID=904295 RepID=A0ABT9Y1E2_9BACI|nr:hypothetical protein [Neobacillus ginsengisoli]MDQ0201566.1 hypothetical protein [Neobacillus ginsengisoli]
MAQDLLGAEEGRDKEPGESKPLNRCILVGVEAVVVHTSVNYKKEVFNNEVRELLEKDSLLDDSYLVAEKRC